MCRWPPSPVKAELTTPTGAAILTTIVQEWVDQPVMTIERIGHGAGRREFLEQPNLLRLFVGTAAEQLPQLEDDEVWVLETNLDDLPAEVIGYCYERLLAAGALDVFSTPIQMKKNRPGVLLSVLAKASDVAALEDILFRETTTFGIRRHPARRHKLQRAGRHRGDGAGAPSPGSSAGATADRRSSRRSTRIVPHVAHEQRIALREVYAAVQKAYEQNKPTASAREDGLPR